MIAYIKANPKPFAMALVLIAIYVLHFFPQLKAESELLAALAAAFGLYGTAFIPSFSKPSGDDNG